MFRGKKEMSCCCIVPSETICLKIFTELALVSNIIPSLMPFPASKTKLIILPLRSQRTWNLIFL